SPRPHRPRLRRRRGRAPRCEDRHPGSGMEGYADDPPRADARSTRVLPLPVANREARVAPRRHGGFDRPLGVRLPALAPLADFPRGIRHHELRAGQLRAGGRAPTDPCRRAPQLRTRPDPARPVVRAHGALRGGTRPGGTVAGDEWPVGVRFRVAWTVPDGPGPSPGGGGEPARGDPPGRWRRLGAVAAARAGTA